MPHGNKRAGRRAAPRLASPAPSPPHSTTSTFTRPVISFLPPRRVMMREILLPRSSTRQSVSEACSGGCPCQGSLPLPRPCKAPIRPWL